MFLSVLIPIYNLDSKRKRNLKFVYNRLVDSYDSHEIEIIFGIQDEQIDENDYSYFDRATLKHYAHHSKKFNKSYIFNRCVDDGIKGKYLVFLDTDVYFPFGKLRDQLEKSEYNVIRPFFDCIFLDENTTEEFLTNKKATASKDLKRIAATGACSIILNKKILNSVRMDENYTGWGWEDIDFANQLSLKYHIHILRDQSAVHLYHEPSKQNNANYEYYKKKYAYKHKKYNRSHKKDIGIIISYFSPCNFKKPRENLLKVIDSFESAGCPVILVEAIMPNADPLVVPGWVDHHPIHVNHKSILFIKENLYNIGIKKTKYEKLLFLDSDILFDDQNFIDNSSSLLNNYDIIQPYERTLWLDEQNTPLLDFNFRDSAAKAINHGLPVDPLVHHPGFAWGATRKFLDYVGGLYDNHPLGGSDLVFSFALSPENLSERMVRYWSKTNQLWMNTNIYKLYKTKISNFNPRVGYLKNCICRHLYHGMPNKRKYTERNTEYLPKLIDNDYPVTYNEYGILEWIDEQHAIKCLEYFRNRDEDS